MWNLDPWPAIEPGPPALGVCHLSHWTTRDVPIIPTSDFLLFCVMIIPYIFHLSLAEHLVSFQFLPLESTLQWNSLSMYSYSSLKVPMSIGQIPKLKLCFDIWWPSPKTGVVSLSPLSVCEKGGLILIYFCFMSEIEHLFICLLSMSIPFTVNLWLIPFAHFFYCFILLKKFVFFSCSDINLYQMFFKYGPLLYVFWLNRCS